MRIAVIVNDAAALEPSQTTTLMAQGAVALGHHVFVVGIEDLSVQPEGGLRGRALAVQASGSETLVGTRTHSVRLDQVDRVWIRTSPGRDAARAPIHATALELLAVVGSRGVEVTNAPLALIRAASKSYLAQLPLHTRPAMLISRSAKEVAAFIEARGSCVVKPLVGTRGRDVLLLEDGDPNLRQLIDMSLRDNFALVQEYVPEAVDGDVRIFVVDGEPMTVNGCVAAVRRRPPEGDFRSNVAMGGRAEPVVPKARLLEQSRSIGKVLVRDGLRVAGLDFVGDRVVEVNVFSPGGLHDAREFYGGDFVGALCERLCAEG